MCVHERRHAIPNLIANLSGDLEGLSGWIGERPVIARNAGHVWTLVTAAHGDEQRGSVGELCRQPTRTLRREIDPDFSHDLDHDWVYLVTGSCARRHRFRPRRVRERPEERFGHLGPARVLDTGEDHAIYRHVGDP